MDLSFLKSALATAAPTLATMLGGPFAGAAVSALENAFGLQPGAGAEAITKVVQAGGMTPEVMAAVRAADQKHAEIMGQQGIDLVKLNADHETAEATLSVENTKDARDMQKVTHSRVPAALSIIVTVGFLGLLTGMMTGKLQADDNQAMLLMLGALGVAFGQVMNYWLGSTRDSSRKTELLAAAPALKP